jgi:hypothetical protein
MAAIHEQPPPYEDVSPPEYADNFTVQRRHNTRKSDEIKCILLDSHGAYTLGDLISGNVVVCPVRNVEVDCILIDFVLVESCIMTAGKVLPRTIKKVSISHHKVPTDSLQDGVLYEGLEYTFPFSILIPYALPMSACRREEHSDLHSMLPASIGAPYNNRVDRKQLDDLPDVPARLTYGLRVRLAKNDQKVKEYFKVLKFNPTYPVDEYVTHYQGNYQSTKSIKISPFQTHDSGQLSLEAPQPMVLGLRGSSNLTDLVLNLKFRSIKKNRVPIIRRLNYKVISRLTVTPPKLAPTSLRPQVETLSSQTFDTKTVDWEQRGSNYVSQVHVPIFLPEDQRRKLTPTFATCMVSREYEIIVQLQAGSRANPKKNIEITVPLILVSNKRMDRRTSMESISFIDSSQESLNLETQKYCSIETTIN